MTPVVRRGITLSNAKQVLARITTLNLAHTDVIFSQVMVKSLTLSLIIYTKIGDSKKSVSQSPILNFLQNTFGKIN